MKRDITPNKDLLDRMLDSNDPYTAMDLAQNLLAGNYAQIALLSLLVQSEELNSIATPVSPDGKLKTLVNKTYEQAQEARDLLRTLIAYYDVAEK